MLLEMKVRYLFSIHAFLILHTNPHRLHFEFILRTKYSSECILLTSRFYFLISAFDLFICSSGSALHQMLFITSVHAASICEQTAVCCSEGDGMEILNRLIQGEHSATNTAAIHQKKCLMGRVFTPLPIFHHIFRT